MSKNVRIDVKGIQNVEPDITKILKSNKGKKIEKFIFDKDDDKDEVIKIELQFSEKLEGYRYCVKQISRKKFNEDEKNEFIINFIKTTSKWSKDKEIPQWRKIDEVKTNIAYLIFFEAVK